MEQIEQLLEALRVLPHVAALAFAYVLALPIGWDRERNERSAGLRTFPLAAVASCGFVQAAEGVTGRSPEEQARISKQVGAGQVTAAGLQVNGAVGAAVGLGRYDVAIVVALFTIFTFRVLSPVKQQKTPSDDKGHPSGLS